MDENYVPPSSSDSISSRNGRKRSSRRSSSRRVSSSRKSRHKEPSREKSERRQTVNRKKNRSLNFLKENNRRYCKETHNQSNSHCHNSRWGKNENGVCCKNITDLINRYKNTDYNPNFFKFFPSSSDATNNFSASSHETAPHHAAPPKRQFQPSHGNSFITRDDQIEFENHCENDSNTAEYFDQTSPSQLYEQNTYSPCECNYYSQLQSKEKLDHYLSESPQFSLLQSHSTSQPPFSSSPITNSPECYQNHPLYQKASYTNSFNEVCPFPYHPSPQQRVYLEAYVPPSQFQHQNMETFNHSQFPPTLFHYPLMHEHNASPHKPQPQKFTKKQSQNQIPAKKPSQVTEKASVDSTKRFCRGYKMQNFTNMKKPPKPFSKDFVGSDVHCSRSTMEDKKLKDLIQPTSDFFKCLNSVIKRQVKQQVTRHVSQAVVQSLDRICSKSRLRKPSPNNHSNNRGIPLLKPPDHVEHHRSASRKRKKKDLLIPATEKETGKR